jgi:hypothetical protein
VTCRRQWLARMAMRLATWPPFRYAPEHNQDAPELLHSIVNSCIDKTVS